MKIPLINFCMHKAISPGLYAKNCWVFSGIYPISYGLLRYYFFHFVGKPPVAWKEYCGVYCLEGLQKSMDRCNECCDITEILLKTMLKNIQLSISSPNLRQFYNDILGEKLKYRLFSTGFHFFFLNPFPHNDTF